MTAKNTPHGKAVASKKRRRRHYAWLPADDDANLSEEKYYVPTPAEIAKQTAKLRAEQQRRPRYPQRVQQFTFIADE